MQTGGDIHEEALALFWFLYCSFRRISCRVIGVGTVGRYRAYRCRRPERLADLSRLLQILSLQPAWRRSTPAMSAISASPGCTFPGRSTRGLQSMPLVADGVLYYTGSYSRTFALNGATGEVIWSYFPELDEALVARQTHSPYNRGVALGEGKVYVGTMDGRLIALDMKTGKVAWDTKLVDSQKLTVGFTGAPLYAKGTVIIGAQGGEWPGRGPIFGVDAATGKKKWEFLTVAGTDESHEDLGQRLLAHRRRRRLDAGHLRRRDQHRPGGAPPTRRRSTIGRAPTTRRKGARPGDNLYTTSVDRARSRYRQAQILPPGAAARRLGLRQRRRRVRDARTRRQEARRASQQERLHLRLRPQSPA